jgi:hypothetical protein
MTGEMWYCAAAHLGAVEHAQHLDADSGVDEEQHPEHQLEAFIAGAKKERQKRRGSEG